ncbi:unnamed protein product [Candidatus Paraburkholderia kirkii UZHbot1]|uniref:WGS project CAFE00000000 data, contig bkir_c58 n=1 Tax=Candidatus Paraburkholderia kirkii UZHbot1 TaxID=1055526 RepID=U3UAY7_9BURK|nr:unnamed protein product [Candidatus Paraburkholderia kirkii UZHbot1]
MAKRLKAMGSARYENDFVPTLHEDLIDLPRKWKKPRTVFVNSMSDLFQEAVPLDFIQRVFQTMMATTQHTYQVLTKRSERPLEFSPLLPWAPNIWMRVSMKDARVLHRIEHLAATAAQLKFLSCEPLIGPIDHLPLDGIDWVIVGGESGRGARPMEEAWVQSIRHQCRAHRAAFFFKQWGGVRKDMTGRLLNGRTYDAMPRRKEIPLVFAT